MFRPLVIGIVAYFADESKMIGNVCGEPLFCGFCYEGAKGRRFHRGHFGYRDRRPFRCMEVIDVRKPVASGPGARAAASVNVLAQERVLYPTVFQYLTDAVWDDGSPRETSTLMLLVEDGWLKACLNDRAMGRSLWVTGDALADVLAALELHLASGSGDWRVKKPFGATGKRK